MSKKKKYEALIKSYDRNCRKRKAHDFHHNDGSNIINGKESLYTHSVTSLDGKRPDKRTCIYYNKDTEKCTNKKCSKIICSSAKNCTCYKRKEKEIKNNLSNYDENYINLPNQEGIHERTNEYIAISKNIGTPMHVGYLKSEGHRRHKAKCLYYDKVKKFCNWFAMKCPGSSKCDKYEEKI